MIARNFVRWAACLALVGIGGFAYGLPVLVESDDPGVQDPLFVQGEVHELGDFFPPDELIFSQTLGITQQTACFDGNDDPGLPNYLVEIRNLTQFSWPEVYYVTDPETSITNFDGFIGNLGLGDFQEAFRIDSVGINVPLIFESLIPDNVFQPGEVWEFIVQDYVNPLDPGGAFVTPFDSPGIASLSSGLPPSSASIIAVPEPTTLGLLALGLGLVSRRRR